eukprot:s3465_g6.t1
MTSFDVLDAEMERLKSLSGGGSSLEPILRGFHDAGFQAAVQQFAAERAAHFQATCPDGSQPLIWTQYFNEYRELFEMHLRHILHGLGMTEDTFHELCGYLQEMMLGVCGVCAFASICLPFVAFHIRDHSKDIETASCGKSLNSQGGNRAITSSEDYDAFLQLMFAEVQRQQSLGAGTSQEIEVVVPEGMGAGETLPVDYLGARYELIIPDPCLQFGNG